MRPPERVKFAPSSSRIFRVNVAAPPLAVDAAYLAACGEGFAERREFHPGRDGAQLLDL